MRSLGGYFICGVGLDKVASQTRRRHAGMLICSSIQDYITYIMGEIYKLRENGESEHGHFLTICITAVKAFVGVHSRSLYPRVTS